MPEHPIANGHQWPCTGYYTNAHMPGFVFTCTCDIGRADNATVKIRQVIAYLRSQAVMRFDRYGGQDARGAALWDAAVALDPSDGDVLNLKPAAERVSG